MYHSYKQKKVSDMTEKELSKERENYTNYTKSMKGKIIFKIDEEQAKGSLNINDLKSIRNNIDGFIQEQEERMNKEQ
jgi:hypothetical protein